MTKINGMVAVRVDQLIIHRKQKAVEGLVIVFSFFGAFSLRAQYQCEFFSFVLVTKK